MECILGRISNMGSIFFAFLTIVFVGGGKASEVGGRYQAISLVYPRGSHVFPLNSDFVARLEPREEGGRTRPRLLFKNGTKNYDRKPSFCMVGLSPTFTLSHSLRSEHDRFLVPLISARKKKWGEKPPT